MSEDVLVIGAGPAGLNCAFYLRQQGISYKVLDRAELIASTWDSLYPSLRLNTSRFFSHMPHKRFPLHYGIFPTGRQYHDYLAAYQAEQQFNIEFGVSVECVEPVNGGWRVDTHAGSAWYPVVINATGRFNNPFSAQIPGLDEFQGEVLHTHDYTGPDAWKDRRIMIVGNGPSGTDLAIELGQDRGTDNPVLLSMRTGILLGRRYPLGLPKHAWMMLAEWLPEALRRKLMGFIGRIDFGDISRYGIKTPEPGQASGAAATRGPELIDAVRSGQVRCVDGPARFHEHSVTLDDGSTHEIDAVILATGYQPALAYLTHLDLTPDSQGWPERYNSRNYDLNYAAFEQGGTYGVGPKIDAQMQPLLREIRGYPGLFLVGVYYKGKGAMYNFRVEAEVASHQIRQYLTHHPKPLYKGSAADTPTPG